MREKREFNFAQRWVDGLTTERENSSKWNHRVLLVGGLAFLGLVGSTPWLWEYKLARNISQVEQKIASLGSLEPIAKQIEDLKTQVAGQEQMLDLMQKSTRDPGPILEKLKTTLPVGTVVNTFSLQGKAMTMGVSIPTPVDVARLWMSLRDSGMFQEVDIQTVSLQDKVQTLNFNLNLK